MKPVAAALVRCGVAPTIVFTGQHPRLDPRDFGLAEYSCVNLHEPGREDPHSHVGAVTKALLPLLRPPPDLLVVQGDTSSALGAALAGFAAGVPVAHVEAGLRTHDPLLPWPEEEYRVAIDGQADLLFAPTQISAANLSAEKVPGKTHVTGNTSIDALLEQIALLPTRRPRQDITCQILVTCHRRETWRTGLWAVAQAIRDIAASGRARLAVILHPNKFVTERMRQLLEGASGVSLIEPCGHAELLGRMRDADLVLSDSGGIQEEAPALGVPLLILREKTERPEGISAGTSRLVGTDRDRIFSEVMALIESPERLAGMSRPVFPFGDGHAAPHIASIMVDWLERRALTYRLA